MNKNENQYVGLARPPVKKSVCWLGPTPGHRPPPVKPPVNFNAVISASKIKAQHALSFADCFAVATAQRENAVILTGDPEFKTVEKFVKIDWLDF